MVTMTSHPTVRRGTLGTFAGVFTPSILTILGIILFLRMGFVVGNAGLTQALLIIALATGVAVLTSISLAAIATNIQVKGGVVTRVDRFAGPRQECRFFEAYTHSSP